MPVSAKPVHVAKRYEPKPYWGCPNCGASTWGATNPTGPLPYIYVCHGHRMGMMSFPGCGTLFTLPDEAHQEYKQELIADGFKVED